MFNSAIASVTLAFVNTKPLTILGKVGLSPSEKIVLFASLEHPKNDEKCLLFHLKSSFLFS